MKALSVSGYRMGSCLSWYLSFQLIGVRKGYEEQELKQRHCVIGQLVENPTNYH